MREAELARQLEEVLRPVIPKVAVSGLERMPGGASRETWAFDAKAQDGATSRLILRRDPPGGRGSGLRLEASLLAEARRAGVPVPRVVTSGDEGGPLSSAFVVMDYVEGETIPRRVLRDEGLAAVRSTLAEACGEILAAIHRIPPSSLPELPRPDPLSDLRSIHDALGQPHPAFELAFRWLSANRPPPCGHVVVHGDFRNGNLIVGPDGIRAVLDWELAHVGDPVEDLGWLCVKAWRFGSRSVVGGFGSVEQLVAGYTKNGGVPVDGEVLRWWETFGTLRWGVICIVQALTHLSGAVRSVELAAIGRRVCEVEWDLLELLR
jgi:aminoglycoside phosphotransferase (APT) family kinase protein